MAGRLRQRWQKKFQHALRGLIFAVKTQDSFLVHLPMAAGVVLLAVALQVTAQEWAVLLICIAVVIAAELFNTSIELLIHRLHPQQHSEIGRALDTAASAVLIVSVAAAITGIVTFGNAFYRLWIL